MNGLRARGISKQFGGTRALDSVDLDVASGEAVGLIGPNGAGKTTCFNCLLGLTRPDDGTVWFGETDITRWPVYRRARLGIARTFQRLELFSQLSVRDHLVVAAQSSDPRARRGLLLKDLTDPVLRRGRPSAAHLARVDETLELLDLTDVADSPVEALSLGRGRMVELARALMTNPKLLLADEPSSGLDRHETAEMVEVLARVRREHGTALLLVEHDVAMVRAAVERLYVLHFGKVIASGPTDSVLADPEVRQAYLGVAS